MIEDVAQRIAGKIEDLKKLLPDGKPIGKTFETRHLSYRQKHEILFCELPKTEFWKLSTVDEYTAESYFLTDEQFDVKIKNELLAKAIETLTERKKEVIFLSYFQGMSDAAIARKLNLVRSTVCEHRTRSLELLKNTMEEYGYENYR